MGTSDASCADCLSLAEALEWAKTQTGQVCELKLADGVYTEEEVTDVRGRMMQTSTAGSPNEFDDRTSSSEVRLIGEGGGALLQLTFNVKSGAPIVTFSNLAFDATPNRPAIIVDGGNEVVVENSNFTNNAYSALRVQAGVVKVRNTRFIANGRRSLRLGGAIYALGGETVVDDCWFEDNAAQDGGAIFARLDSRILLRGSTFVRNNATVRGGAISIAENALLTMGYETKVVFNNAPSARSVFIDYAGRAEATYTLPAPRGHWVSNTVPCDGTSTPPCVPSSLRTVLLRGAHEDDVPFTCAPGLIGDSLEPAMQNNPQCSGVCPAGFSCGAATIVPTLCPTGTHCVPGSSAPTPCDSGTFGSKSGLISQQECETCPPGSWCRGGNRYLCPKSTYNPVSGASDVGACLDCPHNSITAEEGMDSIEMCECNIAFFDAREIGNASLPGPQCRDCFTGTDCQTSGISLRDLPLSRGYYRPSTISIQVKRCPDAAANCTSSASNECPQSTSGCLGKPDEPCLPGLNGTFCMLCANRTSAYYVEASEDEDARCEPCTADTGEVIGSIVGIAFAALAAVVLLYVLAILSRRKLSLKQFDETGVIARFRLPNKFVRSRESRSRTPFLSTLLNIECLTC